MKFSRRKFLAGASVLALMTARPEIADAWFPHGATASNFNGGKSQLNFNTPNGSGEFPFANLIKTSSMSFVGTPGCITGDVLDSTGLPLSFPAGTTSFNFSINIPSQNEFATNYSLTWTGTGVASFTITGGMTVVSGSLTPSGGVGSAVIVQANSSAGPGPGGCLLGFNGPAQNIVLCDVGSVSAVAANPNAFHPQFLKVIRALKPGVLRFLNWLNGNDQVASTWASRVPTTYFSFANGAVIPNLYAGASTNSGCDMSVGLPPGGFTLAHGAQLQFFISANPTNSTTAVNGTFNNSTPNITMTNHGLMVNNQVYLVGSPIPTGFTGYAGFITSGPVQTYFVTSVVDANTIQLSATKGGAAIQSGSNTTCNVNPWLTISVNGGAAIPIFNSNCYPNPQGFINYPTGNGQSSCRQMVYDSTFGAFIDFGKAGQYTCVPPEVCLDLCYQVGAHPWFCTPYMACDPATDWLTGLGNLIQTTYQNGKAPWMIPRFETPNECWNTAGSVDTQYAFRKGTWYGWNGNPGVCYNWVGKVASICGQQLANVFGGGNLGTKYHWIVGINTAGDSPTDQNDRLASTLFLSSDPEPLQSPYGRYAAAGGGGSSPQNWVSHVCGANYFSPLERFKCQELIDAFAWSVTYAGNATQQNLLAGGYIDTLVNQSATVTVTSGSPNITWTSHGQVVNNGEVFTTTPPAGFTIGTQYYVQAVIDANTITLAATQSAGSPITPTGNGSPTLGNTGAYCLARNFLNFSQFKAWAAGYSVNHLSCYEGGYSPDYVPSDWKTSITGATQAASCVLTFAATTTSGEGSSLTGNPAVVGMAIRISSVTGMTQLNNPATNADFCTFTAVNSPSIAATNTLIAGQVVVFTSGTPPAPFLANTPYYVLSSGLSGTTFELSATSGGAAITFAVSGTAFATEAWAVTNVSGNLITIACNSTGFGAYVSGGTATYVSSSIYSNNLRGAGKLCTSSPGSANGLQGYLTQNYNMLISAGAEFPSCFQLGNLLPKPGGDVWSILDDIYQPFSTSPQALAIQAYNA